MAAVGEPALARVERELAARPRRWLVTGAAGFIGSHLVERLLALDQEVRALDDLSTGTRANLASVEARVGPERWRRFDFHEGDVRDGARVAEACAGVELVLHEAALGSVPRSMADPARTLAVNAEGTWTVLAAARAAGATRVVLASSSSVYGDNLVVPAREEAVGRPLSPYAASKVIAEQVARGFARGLGFPVVALRYYNVFGPRQDPSGTYAAVIPRWVAAFARGTAPLVHGDAAITRDFTPVAAVVGANLLAACAEFEGPELVVNVGTGRETSLARLFEELRDELVRLGVPCGELVPEVGPARAGDRRRSCAELTRARERLGYEPPADIGPALRETVRALCSASARR